VKSAPEPDAENPNVHPASTEPPKCEWKRGDQFHTASSDSKMRNPQLRKTR